MSDNAIMALVVLGAVILVAGAPWLLRRWSKEPGVDVEPHASIYGDYTVIVAPLGGIVRVAIHCASHPWLRHLPALTSMGADVLSVEVPPDEVRPARMALIVEADKLVQAIQTAWGRGWRPEALEAMTSGHDV